MIHRKAETETLAANDDQRAAGSSPRGRIRGPLVMPGDGDIIAEKYRVERMIGAGGMGTVFEATHLVMESSVALKWLCPGPGDGAEARERFLREARAAARIRHPNVVQVFDVGEQDGGLYMVMELLEGESFEALIRRGNMPVPSLLQLLVQAMWGVEAAHRRGIVHRDIKPENIFVVADPTQPNGLRAKVLDFGISKIAGESPMNTGLTKSGVSMGTPAYMSLEQINGARDVDERTDVYAFGVLMYRALTGQLPFEGETFAALSIAVATQTPTSPSHLRPELSAALSDTVMRAMARDRDARFATLQELLDVLMSLSTLEDYLGQMSQPSLAPPGTTPRSASQLRVDGAAAPDAKPPHAQPTPPQPDPRRRWGRLSLVVLALMVTAAGGWLLWRRGAAPTRPEVSTGSTPSSARPPPSSAQQSSGPPGAAEPTEEPGGPSSDERSASAEQDLPPPAGDEDGAAREPGEQARGADEPSARATRPDSSSERRAARRRARARAAAKRRREANASQPAKPKDDAPPGAVAEPDPAPTETDETTEPSAEPVDQPQPPPPRKGVEHRSGTIRPDEL